MSAQKVVGAQNVAQPLADEIDELWLATKPTSLWRDAWYRLLRNKLAVACCLFVILMILVAIFADVLMPFPYDKSSLSHADESPSATYILGTDYIGRDMLSRIIYGARVSLIVGLGAQIIILLFGIPV